MSEYLHGAYGQIQPIAARVAEKSQNAMIYVGTAPVHQVAGGADNVNTPIVVNNMAEAMKYFGYSDDWSKYTLCEAMHVHLENKGVGPLVLINVLDPAVHKGRPADHSQRRGYHPGQRGDQDHRRGNHQGEGQGLHHRLQRQQENDHRL